VAALLTAVPRGQVAALIQATADRYDYKRRYCLPGVDVQRALRVLGDHASPHPSQSRTAWSFGHELPPLREKLYYRRRSRHASSPPPTLPAEAAAADEPAAALDADPRWLAAQRRNARPVPTTTLRPLQPPRALTSSSSSSSSSPSAAAATAARGSRRGVQWRPRTAVEIYDGLRPDSVEPTAAEPSPSPSPSTIQERRVTRAGTGAGRQPPPPQPGSTGAGWLRYTLTLRVTEVRNERWPARVVVW
jgi:hypothetical protein